MPSRYTLHTLRLTITLLSGITFFILFEAIYQLIQQKLQEKVRSVTTLLIFLLASFFILVEPVIDEDFPTSHYVVGHYPKLYTFLQNTPKDSNVASLLNEAANLPSFSQRGILVGIEYGIAFHKGYYEQFSNLAKQTIQSHFSPDISVLQDFISNKNVSFWLVNNQVFSDGFLQKSDWHFHFPEVTNIAIATLESSDKLPALQRLEKQCTVFTEKDISLIDSQCILATKSLD